MPAARRSTASPPSPLASRIASETRLHYKGVKTLFYRIRKRAGVRNRIELVVWVMEREAMQKVPDPDTSWKTTLGYHL